MAESTTAKAKTAEHPAFPFRIPNYEIPKFDLPNVKMPEAFRELAEKGVTQAKENYEKMQVAADEMTAILDKTYSTAVKGVADYNHKLIEMARANSNTALEFISGLVATKSLPEMIELSTEQARNQFALVAEQSRELWALAEKMAPAWIWRGQPALRRPDRAEPQEQLSRMPQAQSACASAFDLCCCELLPCFRDAMLHFGDWIRVCSSGSPSIVAAFIAVTTEAPPRP